MQPEDHFDDDFMMQILRDPAGVSSPASKSHLDSCEICRDRLEMHRSIQSFMKGEAEFELPQGWLERMLRLFDPRQMRAMLPAQEKFAWLAFDSLVAGGEGTRTAAVQRHLIWELRDFRIDMMVESSDRSDIELIGQLTAKSQRSSTVQEATTVEVKVRDSVFTGELNAIGEFIVSVGSLAPGDPVEVRFRLPDHPALALLIPF